MEPTTAGLTINDYALWNLQLVCCMIHFPNRTRHCKLIYNSVIQLKLL